MKNQRMAVMAVVGLASRAPAALTPVFAYAFPASAPSGALDAATGIAVGDQSAAKNDAAAVHFASDAFTATAPPASEPGEALSWPSEHAAILVNTPGLLTTSQVAANGGFTIDLWFYANSLTGTQSLMDDAGVNRLQLSNNALQFYFNGSTVADSVNVLAKQWYHVVASFDTTGHSAMRDSNYPGEYNVAGTASLMLDGKSAGSASTVTMSGYADATGYGISLGRNPTQYANEFSGAMYDPALFLGTTLPEPSTLSIIGLAIVGLLRRR